jgi:rod shape-determining protein MreB and related proteins
MSGFLASLLRSTIYVQISRDRLRVRDPKKGRELAGPPELAITGTGTKVKVVGFGDSARVPRPFPVEILRPFAHPRTPVSDFTVAEQLLRAFLRSLIARPWFAASPRIVMHPLEDYEGGLTQVEIRALRELALGTGASEAVVWVGPDLNDADLLAPELPGTGRALT